MPSLVDPERLVLDVLRGFVPAGTVLDLATDTNVSRAARAVLVSAPTGAPIPNAAAVLGQAWQVAVTVLSRDRVEAGDLARDVFEYLTESEGRRVPGAGVIATVEPVLLPVRVPSPTATPAVASFTQFNFTITVRVVPDRNI